MRAKKITRYNFGHKKDVKIIEDFTQDDYDQVYRLIKDSIAVCLRFGTYSKYSVLLRAQRVVSERNYKGWSAPKNEVVYRALRDTRRSMSNPALIKLNGVRIVNDIFDMIDNISGTKPADVESSMLELKDTVRSMNRLNEEAKAVSGKCQIIADNLSNICKYMDGEVETIDINSGCKHAPVINSP